LGSSDNIDTVYGYWYVPGRPAEGGALVFLFNGIESTGGDWIMQPVLQWGDNGNFGGDYYTFASWLVGPESSGYAAYSTPIVVNVDDYLWGDSYQNGAVGAGNPTLDYEVVAADVTSQQKSTLYLTSQGLHWILAFSGVLEAYSVTSCYEYPSGLGGGSKETHVKPRFLMDTLPMTFTRR